MELKDKDLSLKTPYGNVLLKRNKYGIPVIKAGKEAALYYAQGWVQMNDRQLQAYMLKIIFSAKAAECLDPKLIHIDEYMLKFPFSLGAQAELSKLPDQYKTLLQAFVEGCNSWFDTHKKRWEWKLIGYDPEPFTQTDVLVIARAFGFIGLSDGQMGAKKFIIEMIRKGVSSDKVKSIFPQIKEEIPVELIKHLTLGETVIPKEITQIIPSFSASNNWVISGQLSQSGRPILAGDPHLQVNRLPAIWQEVILDLDGRTFKGFTIPGLPGALVGRTPDLAWSPTYSFLDMLEYRIERIKEGKFLRGKKWFNLEKRTEKIRVKKKDPHEIHFYHTDHGLVEGYRKAGQADGYYLSIAYSAEKDTGAAELIGVLSLFHATTAKQGMKIFRTFEAPSFNWVLADGAGNIGYQMSGRAFKRLKDNSGLIPKEAWKEKPAVFLNSKEMPAVFNPKENFIVTANEDKNDFCKYKICNIYMASYRADRIQFFLEKKNKFTVEDMQRMQLDIYSTQAELFCEQIKDLIPDTPAGRILKTWDFRYDPDSCGAVFFERFYYRFMYLVFGCNGIGEKAFEHVWNETSIFVSLFGFFDAVLLQDESPWFTKEEKRNHLMTAIEWALSKETKLLKEIRKIYLKHIFFGDKIPSAMGFDYGPVCLTGSRATINQGQFFRDAGMENSFCPSFRLITDMAGPNVWTNLIGGVSDRRFSRFYTNEISRYLKGVYKKY